jgi:D-alanyl-D-alanine dipeptidase
MPLKYSIAALLIATAGCTAPLETPQKAESPIVPQDVPKLSAVSTPKPQGFSPEEFVLLNDLNSGIQIEMRYAGTDNFLGRKIYAKNSCWLRAGAIAPLLRVQEKLRKQNLGLKVWDCFRPVSAQEQMWRIKPDPKFVAPPGKSKHNRGAALDLTLVDRRGRELEMPTEFDDFSFRAAQGYGGASDRAKANRKLLREAMEEEGFTPNPAEWWHFDAPGWKSYSVQENFPVQP